MALPISMVRQLANLKITRVLESLVSDEPDIEAIIRFCKNILATKPDTKVIGEYDGTPLDKDVCERHNGTIEALFLFDEKTQPDITKHPRLEDQYEFCTVLLSNIGFEVVYQAPDYSFSPIPVLKDKPDGQYSGIAPTMGSTGDIGVGDATSRIVTYDEAMGLHKLKSMHDGQALKKYEYQEHKNFEFPGTSIGSTSYKPQSEQILWSECIINERDIGYDTNEARRVAIEHVVSKLTAEIKINPTKYIFIQEEKNHLSGEWKFKGKIRIQNP